MPRNASDIMWANAVVALARIDHLHNDFFRPASQGWEPPVDLLESDGELVIIVALPGVHANELDVTLHGDVLTIAGTRRLPAFLQRARVHRMELPHGRFERRVVIPPGQYELTRRDLSDGLLVVALRRLG